MLKNKRINACFDKITYETLEEQAKRRNMSLSRLVERYTRIALEQEEDKALAKLLDKRLQEATKWVPLEEAFKDAI